MNTDVMDTSLTRALPVRLLRDCMESCNTILTLPSFELQCLPEHPLFTSLSTCRDSNDFLCRRNVLLLSGKMPQNTITIIIELKYEKYKLWNGSLLSGSTRGPYCKTCLILAKLVLYDDDASSLGNYQFLGQGTSLFLCLDILIIIDYLDVSYWLFFSHRLYDVSLIRN
jgi:hypothetical protein